MIKFFNFRTTTLVLLVIMLSAVTYGFAAANTVPTGGAGDGNGAISGYTIGSVDYNLLASNPSLLSSVSFTVTPTGGAGAASVVKIQLNSGGSWYDCSLAASVWTCAFPVGSEPTVLAASNLRVVATE